MPTAMKPLKCSLRDFVQKSLGLKAMKSHLYLSVANESNSGRDHQFRLEHYSPLFDLFPSA